MNGIIYCAFDTTNGKFYVGQTGQSLFDRQKAHLSFKKKFPFRNVLQKRAGEFVWTILISGLTTQKELDEAEIYWGNFFQSMWPNGYNLRLGRGHVVWSEEEKLRQSLRLLGCPRSPEATRKQTEKMIGKKLPGVSFALRGKPKSEQHRANISKGKTGVSNGHEGKKQSPEWVAARVAGRERNKALRISQGKGT